MSRLGCLWFSVFFLAAFLSAHGNAQTPAVAQRPAIGNASDLLDLFEMDESFFRRFRDGESWNESEDDPLARILLRLPQIKPIDLERWTQHGTDQRDVASHPAKYQRQFLRLEGRVRRVARVTLSSEQQERYGLTHYYQCEMLLRDESHPAVVFARHVSSKWELDARIDEPASATALLLKRGLVDEPGGQVVYFVVDRMAWHPYTLAGKLGMDYGLFDKVQQDASITSDDRECFYQLLDAAGKLPAHAQISNGAEIADATSRLVSLMAGPQDHVGEVHSFRGTARRAVKIHVSDPDTIARFGIDHYFELMVFIELDGFATIADKKVRNHPVVFCVRELPAEMPTGENIAEFVRASGFMFKKWKYTTQLANSNGAAVRLSSPLLIGKNADWERSEEVQSPVDFVAGGVLLAALGCIGLFAWWYRRHERRIYDALSARRRTISDRSSLNNLEFGTSDAVADIERD